MSKKLDRAGRLERVFRRLGTRNPVCIGCGYSKSPFALELAHIAPKKFHDDVAILCRNCHREQSDAEKDFAYAHETDNPKMETIGRYLLGLSEFFLLIARATSEFGRWLVENAAHVPPRESESGQ